MPLGMRSFVLEAERAGAGLAGCGGGALLLAQTGHLDGYHAVLPQALTPKRASWQIGTALPVIDRDRLTALTALSFAQGLEAWLTDTTVTLRRDPRSTVDQVLAVMRDHTEKPLSVGQLAERLALSPKQLRTRCRQETGKTPTQLYTEIRLAHAAKLVRDSHYSVAEISARAGFASPSSFTRRFRTAYGQAPRVMRLG